MSWVTWPLRAIVSMVALRTSVFVSESNEVEPNKRVCVKQESCLTLNMFWFSATFSKGIAQRNSGKEKKDSSKDVFLQVKNTKIYTYIIIKTSEQRQLTQHW